MGTQELDVPRDGPNRFRAEGPELALAGDWRIEAIARAIGVYPWSTETRVTVGVTPSATPPSNPAPLFGSIGVAGIIAMAIGTAGLAAAAASRAAMTRRALAAAVGAGALAAGALVLIASRIAQPEPAPVVAQDAPAAATSPGAVASPEGLMHQHATPLPDTATPPGPGTAASCDAMTVAVAVSPESAGPTTSRSMSRMLTVLSSLGRVSRS